LGEPPNSLVFDSSGNLYAGGDLFQISPTNATNIAKWNGSVWSGIGVGEVKSLNAPGLELNSLVFDQFGNLYAGGNFATMNGVNASDIAKLSGTNWAPISSGMISGEVQSVYAFAFDKSGNLYAGGQFSAAGGANSPSLAKWNGSVWSALGLGVREDTLILGLACDSSGNLYASGNFAKIGGIAATAIAKWDGVNWFPLGTGLNDYANSLVCDNSGNLYAGGAFTSAGGITGTSNIAQWNGTNWLPLGSGLNGTVSSLALDGLGNLYAGGGFSTAGGINVSNIAQWNGNNWFALGSGVNGSVLALVCDNPGNLYAGGVFTIAGGINATNVAEWNGSVWSPLGTGIAGGSVNCVACDGWGNLYAGGQFSVAGGVPVERIAKWNGTNWSDLGSGMNNDVWSLGVAPSGNLYAGGYFTTAGTNVSTVIAEALLSKSSYNLALANLGGGMNVITGLGTPGYTYALDFATNLTAPVTWIPEMTNTSSSQSVIFTNVSASPQGFYRTRYVPQ